MESLPTDVYEGSRVKKLRLAYEKALHLSVASLYDDDKLARCFPPEVRDAVAIGAKELADKIQQFGKDELGKVSDERAARPALNRLDELHYASAGRLVPLEQLVSISDAAAVAASASVSEASAIDEAVSAERVRLKQLEVQRLAKLLQHLEDDNRRLRQQADKHERNARLIESRLTALLAPLAQANSCVQPTLISTQH
eukprot:TRINITY_DN2348_c0_g1_i4.p1 TRINITY_DN2348_c0_g1~~TRINITY_DN2348_c0_g1_i4.p1  ORF type:complete len:198 (-),score=56.64 TRINITY_DN2348_c0_g1_i4:180-773(-)